MTSWWSRRPDPEPTAPAPTPTPAVYPHTFTMPRMGRGLRWSLLVAEMAAEAAKPPAPNPWSPDPEEAA